MGFKQRLALKARQNRGHDFSAELEELMRLVLNANGCSYAPSALNAFVIQYLGLADSSGSRRTKLFQRFPPPISLSEVNAPLRLAPESRSVERLQRRLRVPDQEA